MRASRRSPEFEKQDSDHVLEIQEGSESLEILSVKRPLFVVAVSLFTIVLSNFSAARRPRGSCEASSVLRCKMNPPPPGFLPSILEGAEHT